MKEAGFGKTRTEALSDGLFAIILTLLVLEIKVPHLPGDHNSPQELFNAMVGLLPKIISWVNSFIVLAVIWVNHHRLLEMLKGMSQTLFWANALILLTVSFIPFPTALWGDYPQNPLAVSFYGLVMILVGLSFYLLRELMQRNPQWLKESINLDTFKAGTKKVLIFGPLLYATGSALAWLSPILSAGIYLGITVYFFFPSSTSTD